MKPRKQQSAAAGARQSSSKVGTPRCGVRTAQRAVPTQGNEEFRPASAAAFTLIEIMMVVAILGLTLTMSIPSFHHMLQREGMGKVERDLVTACQEARRAAIMNNQTTDLVIRPVDHTFSVPGVFDLVTIPPDINIDALGVNFNSLQTSDEARVHFFSKGTSDEFIIILHGSDGSYRTLYLDVVTALVRVEDGAVNPYKR
jgi:prepilin-type N-terminal cleavage/methylation domain-containing protein